MIKHSFLLAILFICSSCSYFTGPEGLYPSTKYDFINENVEEDIELPNDLEISSKENHYPVSFPNASVEPITPKPRQIFATSGDSSVQLRRLGELMWIYIETLPSTSWPISKSYWDTSSYEVISANPDLGELVINFDQDYILKMKIEHGIKEASTEIFLNQIKKNNNEIISNPSLIQAELEKVVSYFAENVGIYSGTSLAAQNLNEMKKAKIFAIDGQTVIELDLNFDRAWSSVSRAMTAANIVSNDKDRTKGIFFVSYAPEEEGGFLSFMGFGGRQVSQESLFNSEAQFEVRIIEKNNKTYVRAYSKNGKIVEAEELLSKINESLS
ncbi:outer membrane protein assembly factor BamC [Gammaproteobacteria bacterium]|nr:outer membrane protein assembly factor BamC [Gammaproteobacteria bacterium]